MKSIHIHVYIYIYIYIYLCRSVVGLFEEQTQAPANMFVFALYIIIYFIALRSNARIVLACCRARMIATAPLPVLPAASAAREADGEYEADGECALSPTDSTRRPPPNGGLGGACNGVDDGGGATGNATGNATGSIYAPVAVKGAAVKGAAAREMPAQMELTAASPGPSSPRPQKGHACTVSVSPASQEMYSRDGAYMEGREHT